MTNTLDEKLQSYFVQLNDAEKKSLMLMLQTFLRGRKENTNRISIDQYNREIDEALAEVEMGNYITQDEMEKQAAKW